jgi:hypothetical protein
MRARAPRRAAVARSLAAAVVLAGLPAAAGAEARPWWAPDHAKVQLAGNIGFVSPGIGWSFARKVEGDLFFGWVPEAVGGDDIFSVTGKLGWAPWTIATGGPWAVRPLTAGLQITYTFGDQYFVVPEFEFTPTALRAGIALGAEARRPVGRRTLGVYAELVALDMGLAYWASNTDALGPEDVFSLALGVRLGF